MDTEIRSERGRRQYGVAKREKSLLAQIPPRQVEALSLKESGMAYYIRPDGATIRETIVLQPNGAPTKHDDGAGDRERLRREKGFEYIGPTLTPEGVRRAVEVMQANRTDYILFLNDEIARADEFIQSSDEPHIRAGQRRRKAQLEALLEEAEAPIDVDGMCKELDEIAQAQKLAILSPEMREAMVSIMGTEMRGLVASVVNSAISPEVKKAGLKQPKGGTDAFIAHEDEA